MKIYRHLDKEIHKDIFVEFCILDIEITRNYLGVAGKLGKLILFSTDTFEIVEKFSPSLSNITNICFSDIYYIDTYIEILSFANISGSVFIYTLP